MVCKQVLVRQVYFKLYGVFWGRLFYMNVLFVLCNNDSHISLFPLGIAYLASACRNAGHTAVVYQQDTHHWPDDYLTSYIDANSFDVVGFGTVAGAYQYKRLIEISKVIEKAKNKPFFVLGGHIVTPEPEYFLKKTGADAIVLGEGELIICDLLDALASGRNLSEVKGIAYMEDGQVKVNARCQPIKNLDELPLPVYDLFEMDHYLLNPCQSSRRSTRWMPMLTGRGCSFNCAFCFRMEESERLRSCLGIIEEAKRLVKDYDVNYIQFYDEHFMASPERAIELSEAIIKSDIQVEWTCAGRLNHAVPEVLTIMRRAGCGLISYKMESMDDDVLRKMNINHSADMIIKGVDNTINADIKIGFSFVFGNLGDTPKTLQKSVDFLLKYEKQHYQKRTIRPITPYPGSPLYALAVNNGLIRDCEDFYENKLKNTDLLTVNFTDMTEDEFYSALYSANKQLLDNYNDKLQEKAKDTLDMLYLYRDVSFRGFRKG